jgi:ribonuclease P protein component
LRRSVDIAAVRSAGRTVRDASFTARARPNELEVVRLAVSAPRTVGPSVLRNRARRRVREAFRTALAAFEGEHGVDLVITARKEAISADFSALRAAATTVLRTVSAPPR